MTPARRIVLFGLLVAAALAAALFLALRRPKAPVTAGLSVAGALSGTDTEGYARAIDPRPFRFPEDHGPHPEFRTEWWYVTGNLADRTGRPFGFQWTVFRSALSPTAAARGSAWGTREAWMAHFAVSDIAGRRFHSSEHWGRGALGLASATGHPFRVWLGPWELAATGEEAFPARLVADGGEAAVDLVLSPGKPVVLQGDRGLSRKGPEVGNASYYYSLSRLPARGRIRVGDGWHEVEGLAWLDREWSTSALSAGQVGWDWLALQLDSESEVMIYRLRHGDGTADPTSRATWIAPDGSSTTWPLAEVGFEAAGSFESPRSGARYPNRFRIELPERRVTLEVRPALADQELDVAFRYWEGAVVVTGTQEGRPVRGKGYVELTGYAAAGTPASAARPPASP